MANNSLYLNPTTPPVWWLSDAIKVLHSAHYPSATVNELLLDVDPGLVEPPPPTPANPSPAASAHAQSVVVKAGNDTSADIDPVNVQLWVAPFSTAIAPSHYLAAFQGPLGASDAKPISAGGTANYEFLANKFTGLSSTTPSGAPSPLMALLNPAGELHVCSYANVWAPGHGAEIQGPPVGTAAVGNFQPATNLLHAQRNLTVKKHPSDADAVEADLFMGSPSDEEEGKHWIEFIQTSPTELTPWEVAEIAQLGPWIRTAKSGVGRRRPGLEVVVGDEVLSVPFKGPQADVEVEIADVGSALDRKVLLGPSEVRKLRLHAKLPQREIGLHVFDLVQHGRRGVVGGARLTVLAVPQEVLRQRPPRDGKLPRDQQLRAV